MEEIRRLKSLLVKHEKRIRALEARATSSTTAMSSQNDTPASANTSVISESPAVGAPATVPPAGANHVTHDTNANLAKAVSTEDMAPDEV